MQATGEYDLAYDLEQVGSAIFFFFLLSLFPRKQVRRMFFQEANRLAEEQLQEALRNEFTAAEEMLEQERRRLREQEEYLAMKEREVLPLASLAQPYRWLSCSRSSRPRRSCSDSGRGSSNNHNCNNNSSSSSNYY